MTSSSSTSSGSSRTRSRNPINPGNRKVLIFSAFADTADYLYRELAPDCSAPAGLHTAMVTGGGHGAKTTLGRGYDFQEVLTLFSPRSKRSATSSCPKETGEIDVLIGTDCICEGQNLQDCDYLINYDIHWNPVRIIQRFGRIDRIGSTNAQIQLVNFWPDISLDEYINLKERVENRMVIADVTATGDDNVLTRAGQRRCLPQGATAQLQDEVIELEDVKTGVSITDLGLNDFRMDLLNYVKEHGDLAHRAQRPARRRARRPRPGPAARRDLRAAQRQRRRGTSTAATACTRTTSSTSTTTATSSPTTPRSSACST